MGYLGRINHFVPLAVVLLFALRVYTGELAFSAAGLVLIACYALAALIRGYRPSRSELVLAAALAVLSLFALMSAERTGYRSVYFALAGWSSLAIGAYFVRNLDAAVFAARVLLIAFLVSFVALGLVHGFGPKYINEFLPHSSRNIVAMLGIFAQIFYSGATYAKTGRLPAITPALIFIVAVLCVGRAGLILSAAILILSWGHELVKATRHRWVLVALAATVSAAASVPLMTAPINVNANRIEAIVERGFDSKRWGMWGGYVSEMSPQEFIFGRAVRTMPEISAMNANPHNSFIRGHSYYGVGYFVFLAVLIGLGALGIGNGQWVLVALATVYAARALFDTYALPDLFDFVVFAVLLLAATPSTDPAQSRGLPRGQTAHRFW